jgi:hypothetical protein
VWNEIIEADILRSADVGLLGLLQPADMEALHTPADTRGYLDDSASPVTNCIPAYLPFMLRVINIRVPVPVCPCTGGQARCQGT